MLVPNCLIFLFCCYIITMKISLRWWIISFLILGMISYMLYSYYSSSPTDSDTIYVWSPITVSTWDIIDTLSFDGTTAFASTQKLTFWQEWKKVTNVLVKVWDKVRQDQVLATLESSEVDSSFKTAKSNLTIAQLNYDKAVASADKEYDLLKANNTLQITQNELNSIDATLLVENNEEDNNIKKAEQALLDAQEDYEDLYNESVNAQSDATRNKRNTYIDAVDDLRDIINSVQTNLNSLDKIMYFTDKFSNGDESEELMYIGAKSPNSISLVKTAFFEVHNAIQSIQDDYNTLSSISADDITVDQLEKSYAKITDMSKSLMNLWNYSRAMFEYSVVSADSLTQNTIDSYINLSNTIYSNARSLKEKATNTMENIYKLDDSLDLVKAQQAIDNAQIVLDKLLLSKQNRQSSNLSRRTTAQLAVSDAKKEIFYIENGYNNTTVQNAYNQLIQAQSNLDTVLKRYENYQLIANFDGTVTEMNVQVWDTISASNIDDTYIYVENPNLIEITLDVEQTDILKLSVWDDVSITLDVFPSDIFSWVISEISTVPVTNNGVSTYTVKAMFERPTEKNILWWMTATVNFTVSQKKNVILVPNSSLTTTNGLYYVTMEDGTQQQVVIWESDDTNTEIISWLVPGDVILGIKISATDLTDSGVSTSTNENNAGPWWWNSQWWSSGPQWWWTPPAM